MSCLVLAGGSSLPTMLSIAAPTCRPGSRLIITAVAPRSREAKSEFCWMATVPLCVPKALNPTIVVMKSAQDGA